MKLRSAHLAMVLAGRQARRQRLRTVAILATLAVPVAVVTAADVVTRTTHLSGAEQLDRQLGGAQAVIDWVGYPLLQTPDPNAQQTEPTGSPPTGSFTQRPGPTSLPASLLPPGATVAAEADASPFLVSAAGGTYVEVRGVDLRSPAPAAGVSVRSGRVPASGDEIALSPPLAAQLQARVGETLRLPGNPITLRVVGIVADRYSPGEPEAFTLPSTAERLQTIANATVQQTGVTRWYVSSPTGVTWPAVEALNARGWQVTSRLVIDHPPPRDQVPYYRQQNAADESQAAGFGGGLPISANQGPDRATTEVGAGLLGVMLLLEVALMAGPAFAVGARRRRHELAVIAASGGASRRQLISFVAADGLLLGGVAALAGAGTGIGAGAVVLACLRAWTSRVPGSVTLRGWEITGIAALALLSGLLAALIPAWSASRADTAQVLRGGQTRARLSWRPGALGIVALAAALVLGLATLNEDSNGGFPVPLVAAAALAELGFVLLTPAVLGLAGLAARRLPLWARIAVRDASRNRSSAAPAVAAVIAVVAAATAALIFGSSVAAHDRVSWLPSLPTGDAVAYLVPEPGVHIDTAAALAAVRAQLPGTDALILDGQTSSSRLVIPVVPGCPAPTIQSQGGGVGSFSSGSYTLEGGANCASSYNDGPYLIDAGPGASAMIGGPAGHQAAAALRAGKAVVFDPSLLAKDGDVTVALGPGQPSHALLPAVAVTSPLPIPVASIILPPSAAAPLDLQSAPSQIYVEDAAAQPAARVRAADQALERLGIDGLYVQAPYSNTVGPALLAVVGADLFLAVAATVAATALVTVDSLDDLLILAAIGAAPRGRRRLAMSRAAIICGIGSICGVAAGLIPGVGLVWRLRQQHTLDTQLNSSGTDTFAYPLHLPWGHLAIVAIAAPLLAAAAAALLNRSTLPSETRPTNAAPRQPPTATSAKTAYNTSP